MIHYSCDLCKRDLDPRDDLRYVVKIEVEAVFDPVTEEPEDDRDHLEEVQDLLEGLDELESGQVGEEIYQKMRFDLCPECRKKFARHPLGQERPAAFHFSEN